VKYELVREDAQGNREEREILDKSVFLIFIDFLVLTA
jgi:hypothetical protein